MDVTLRPRDVHFDWSGTPLHWVPGEPFATHVINVLHLLLPEGERWFVEIFSEALPLIRDERLREDVIGFIGQEAIHSREHADVLGHLLDQGLDASPYTAQIEWMFQRLLGDRADLVGRHREQWLIERLAVVAAIEHLTAYLGEWILNASALDRAGADPVMLDLLRWHGAEEVEHRSVAFDLFTHLSGGYLRRLRTIALVAPVLGWLWVRGVRFLAATDPQLAGRVRPRWRDLVRTGRKGLTPSYLGVLRGMSGYLRPGYHPSRHGSTEQAVAYLAGSPAARAACA